MTFYYQTQSWSSQPQISDETKQLWEHVSNKDSCRIVQLPNGFYQTEYQDFDEVWVDVTRRETIDGAEAAIDGSVEHYAKKVACLLYTSPSPRDRG